MDRDTRQNRLWAESWMRRLDHLYWFEVEALGRISIKCFPPSSSPCEPTEREKITRSSITDSFECFHICINVAFWMEEEKKLSRRERREIYPLKHNHCQRWCCLAEITLSLDENISYFPGLDVNAPTNRAGLIHVGLTRLFILHELFLHLRKKTTPSLGIYILVKRCK